MQTRNTPHTQTRSTLHKYTWSTHAQTRSTPHSQTRSTHMKTRSTPHTQTRSTHTKTRSTHMKTKKTHCDTNPFSPSVSSHHQDPVLSIFLSHLSRPPKSSSFRTKQTPPAPMLTFTGEALLPQTSHETLTPPECSSSHLSESAF